MSSESGPGPTLKAARQAMNVEPREVADALNLPLSVVQAIEANDYAQLPNAVFARGYVRSYAKLLELDPDPLVQQFPMPAATTTDTKLAVVPAKPWTSVLAKIEGGVRENQQMVLVVAAVLAGLLLIMLVVWLVSDPSPTESAAAGTAAARQGSPSIETPASAAAASGSAPRVPAVAVETAADGTQTQRLNEGDDSIRLDFTDECWLEIRSAAGEVLYSDLGQAGATLKFVGSGPFNILLGYAPSATLRFNGEAVALVPHTRNNVATLVLGQ